MMTKISTSKYFSSILKSAANYIFDEGSAGKAMFLKSLLNIFPAGLLGMELTKATRLIFLYGATCSCAKHVSGAFLWVRIFNTGRINDLMSINRLDQRQTNDICTSSVPLWYSCNTAPKEYADNSSIQLEIMLRFGRCIISLPLREDLGTVSTKLLATMMPSGFDGSTLWCSCHPSQNHEFMLQNQPY